MPTVLRHRSSSMPSLAEAQTALYNARKQPARRLVAYVILATFLGVFLVLGFGSGYTGVWEDLNVGGLKGGFPNFESIPGSGIRTITAEELQQGGWKRYIVVGDVHGMMGSYEKMLRAVQYDSSQDLLIHVGDLVAKGPQSAQVMQSMAAANVTGVRGNHDQKVIEWRAWIEWVQSHKGGRAWLRDMESKTPDEIEEMKKKHKNKDKDKKKWKIPEDWEFGGEHYWLARNIKSQSEEYMKNLPLVLHIPSYHLFIVHAGILPLNPTIPLSSKHQPLSHVPGSLKQHANKHKKHHKPQDSERSLDHPDEAGVETRNFSELEDRGLEYRDSAGEWRHRKPKNRHELRTLQEQMILSTIPQNTIPFNLLNIRSLEKNRPTRAKKGRPWSEVWNDVLSKCKGFPDDAVNVALSEEGLPPLKDEDGKERELAWWEKLVYKPGQIIDWDPVDEDSKPHYWSHTPSKLPCHPSAVIYGHAAGRGLDIKRWSLGLDSGCVYGRRMTTLVFSEEEANLGVRELAEMSERDGDEDGVQVEKVKVGDELEGGGMLHGALVSIGCPDIGA